MKKMISMLMILMMVLFTFSSFADNNNSVDTEDSVRESQRVKVLETLLGNLNLQLIDLRGQLIALTGSDSLALESVLPSTADVAVSVDIDDDRDEDDELDENEMDDDDDDDDDDDSDENEMDHEDDDDSDENEIDDDDDDRDADSVSGATSVASDALTPQQLKANTLRLEIMELMNRIESVKEELEEDEESSEQAERSNLKRLRLDSVIMKGITFHFDVAPVLKEGRALVPVRGLTEGLGAKVTWDQAAQKVTIVYQGKTIVLQLGKQTALVNGKSVPLDAAVEIFDNRVLVPIRFIAETLGLSVMWQPESESIVLDKLTVSPPPATTVTKPTTTTPAPSTTTPPADTVSGATPK